MRLKKLVVSGFEAAQEEVTVNFEGKNMLGFVGENGSGKSMLSIWAPVFALFGKVRQRTVNEAISTGAGKAYVELTFSANGSDYKVIRKLPRIGRQEAVLYVKDEDTGAWTTLSTDKVTSTNQQIVEIIGMDYDAARNTFIAEQGKYGLFCESGPSKRREILAELLDLGGYEDLKEAAEEKLKTAVNELATYTAQLEEIDNLKEMVLQNDSELANLDEEELENELEQLLEADSELQKQEAEIAFKRDNADRILSEARSAVEKFTQDKANKITSIQRNIDSLQRVTNPTRIQSLENDLAKIKESKLHLPQVEKKIEELKERISKGEALITDDTNKMEEIREQASKITAEQSSIQSSLRDLKEQKDGLSKSADKGNACCVTCNQPLTTDLLNSILATIQEKEDSLNTRLAETTNQLSKKKADFQEIKNQLETKKNYLQKYMDDKQDLLQSKARLQENISSEQNVNDSLTALRKEQEEARDEIEFLEASLEETKNLEVPQELLTKVNESESLVEEVKSSNQGNFDYTGRNRIALIEKELNNRETARKNEAALDARKAAAEAKFAEASQDQNDYTILRKAFSPTGIPAMIMAGALQELEDDANFYLDKFSRGTLSINMETQRETLKGKVNEEISLSVNAPDGTRDYESFSGGQKFRIDLSLRIAMCKVSARRKGSAAIETFMVDEGFGALDEEGKISAMGALTELSEEMAVIAVSHIDSVKDGFPNLIEVSLETGTTTAKEIKTEN